MYFAASDTGLCKASHYHCQGEREPGSAFVAEGVIRAVGDPAGALYVLTHQSSVRFNVCECLHASSDCLRMNSIENKKGHGLTQGH